MLILSQNQRFWWTTSILGRPKLYYKLNSYPKYRNISMQQITITICFKLLKIAGKCWICNIWSTKLTCICAISASLDKCNYLLCLYLLIYRHFSFAKGLYNIHGGFYCCHLVTKLSFDRTLLPKPSEYCNLHMHLGIIYNII